MGRLISRSKFIDAREAALARHRKAVADAINKTFPPVPSERAANLLGAQWVGVTPDTIRRHRRQEVQKPDRSLIVVCRMIDAARRGGALIELGRGNG